jgi:peptidoglycan/xylan/chitin deacetylase (PgdA/CDA1 family)
MAAAQQNPPCTRRQIQRSGRAPSPQNRGMRPPLDDSWTRRTWLGAALATAAGSALALRPGMASGGRRVPILAYHRAGPTAADSMTLRTANFAAHLRTIRELGCQVIPLADLVAYRLGQRPDLPPKAVVLTADDGHRSVFEVMAPLLHETHWPVTLFIYPSAISNARYAMRWEQLRELQDTGPFNIQSHTYWHPNLVRERRGRPPDDFRRFAELQLTRSKAVLQERMGQAVNLLAWPFGMSDEGLMAQASAHYQAAFGLGNRPCTRADPVFNLPRYLMVDAIDARQLTRLLTQCFDEERAS